MKKRYYFILILLILLSSIAVVSFRSYYIICSDNKSDDIDILSHINKIINTLKSEFNVTNIIVSPDQSMVLYISKNISSQDYICYLWSINEQYPIEIRKLPNMVDNFFWNSTSSYIILCSKRERSIVSQIIQVNDLQKVTTLTSVTNPIWSPNGDQIVTVTTKDNNISLDVYNTNFELTHIIAKSDSKITDYKICGWSSDNTINYISYNLINNSEINRSYTVDRTIYSILGNSNKLSNRVKENMQKWRNEIVLQTRYNAKDLYINGHSNNKAVALTFDDGPDNINTPKILDILKKYNVKASFFVVGEQVEKHPDVVKRIKDEGHLVLNHSYSHKNYADLKPNEIYEDISKTQILIESLIGVKPLLIRTPYGITNNTILKELRKLNNKNILWSTDTLDWSQREAENIIDNTINNVRPGEIILYHNTKYSQETVKALPVIIEKLTTQGYKLVDVGELLGVKAYEGE